MKDQMLYMLTNRNYEGAMKVNQNLRLSNAEIHNLVRERAPGLLRSQGQVFDSHAFEKRTLFIFKSPEYRHTTMQEWMNRHFPLKGGKR